MSKYIPGRPPRLTTVFRKYNPTLCFITFSTFDRRPVLANDEFHNHFAAHMKHKSAKGIACGEYVIMSDHIHLFLRIDPHRYQLGKTVGFIKQALSKPLRAAGIEQPHWQPGFFDHLLRSAESYSAQWEYVQQNPVRAGLVHRADEWKYQGMIVPIQY